MTSKEDRITLDEMPTWCDPLIAHIKESDRDTKIDRNVREIVNDWLHLKENYTDETFRGGSFATYPDKELIIWSKAFRYLNKNVWAISPAILYAEGFWGEAYELLINGTQFKENLDEWGVELD